MPMDEARAFNLANWEDRVAVHVGPGGYDLAAFEDPTHLSDVVRFDMARLGEIDGLDVVHLQCHIGTDTVSLARLGARSVTGYDFSPSALREGRKLAERAGAAVTFVEGELEDAVEVLGGERFDLVYTGVGALCWLPSVDRWAQVVAALLRPGGRLHIREGHPMLWTLSDPRPDGVLQVEFTYFESGGPTVFEEDETYAGDGSRLAHATTWGWNHGIGEIMGALAAAGMALTSFDEHMTVPWNPLGELMEAVPPYGEFRLVDQPERLACTYTLRARKPN